MGLTQDCFYFKLVGAFVEFCKIQERLLRISFFILLGRPQLFFYILMYLHTSDIVSALLRHCSIIKLTDKCVKTL